ncbi:hypothetical protein [Streptomyces sp. NE06-03C]|uniref:hypothetical protein n=1 Tax=Streptomyces sp. NE06-03C TaxID=3028694 RepID=UPI0029AB2452|nr:hypothetical protein [Streptomyces sp. NE06-03C]MDX2921892.1 hypothetical protein [Streptomyces sp. NE06-03C]
MEQIKNAAGRVTSRGLVLAVLGVVTLAVATLSVAVSYDILEPRFGAWAIPTVGALDALWVVFQATEILARNHRQRARRVLIAGLALTAVNAAIPAAELVLAAHRGGARLDLAVILTPVAIVATKTAWWIALPSLGRAVSSDTRQAIATRRQHVADRLEVMEADAAHRVELLEVAAELDARVAKAEARYRETVLKAQQSTTETLHGQAVSTEKTLTAKPVPASAAAIPLPDLESWTPTALALPGTQDAASGTPAITGGTHDTQVSDPDAESGTPGGTGGGTGVTLDDLAAVAGVPVPQPDEPLTDAQMGVVLRHLRYTDDPPLSYRQARDAYRRAGYVGSEQRVRIAWGALVVQEDGGETHDTEDAEEASA